VHLSGELLSTPIARPPPVVNSIERDEEILPNKFDIISTPLKFEKLSTVEWFAVIGEWNLCVYFFAHDIILLLILMFGRKRKRSLYYGIEAYATAFE
jgi:hypothetical protein